MADELQEPKPITATKGTEEAKHPWPLNILQEAWPTLKIISIPLTCIFIGGLTMHFLYSTFIIPGKEETVKSIGAERDLYKAEVEWPIKHTTNAIGGVGEITNNTVNSKTISNTNAPVFKTNSISNGSDEKALLSPEAIERVRAKMLVAQHVPVRVIIPRDDPDALPLADQIWSIFADSGFNIKGVEKADYKQPHVGVSLMFRNKPTGILWDALFQIWFELLQAPYTDYEDAMSGSDIWVFVTSK